MKIKRLKELNQPKLYNKAIEHQAKGRRGVIDDEIYLTDRHLGFCWIGTKEGKTFWKYVNAYRFDKAREIEPDLFQ